MEEKGKVKIRCKCGTKIIVELGPEKTPFTCPDCGYSTTLPALGKVPESPLGGKVPEPRPEAEPVGEAEQKAGGPVDFSAAKTREEAETHASHLAKLILENVRQLLDAGNTIDLRGLLHVGKPEIKDSSADEFLFEYYLGSAAFREMQFAEAEEHFKHAAKGFPNWDTLKSAAEECRRNA